MVSNKKSAASGNKKGQRYIFGNQWARRKCKPLNKQSKRGFTEMFEKNGKVKEHRIKVVKTDCENSIS